MHCESNAVMAGTLANGGVCPITGEKILSSEAVEHVLALMSSCGMSIFSGQFAFNVIIIILDNFWHILSDYQTLQSHSSLGIWCSGGYSPSENPDWNDSGEHSTVHSNRRNSE